MPESEVHAKIVECLVNYLVKNYLDGDRGSVLVDSRAVDRDDRTYFINDYVPDIICSPQHGNYEKLIGEAKTEKDIDRSHSLKQYEAFLRYCTKTKNSLFFLGVPFPLNRYARSVIRKIARKADLDESRCIVLDEFLL